MAKTISEIEREVAAMPGLKHKDFKPCMGCGKGVAHANGLTFYRVKIDRFILDARKIQRAHGLEMMMGGNAMLANIMGPNADLAKQISSHQFLLCDDCSIRGTNAIAMLEEKANDKERDADEEQIDG